MIYLYNIFGIILVFIWNAAILLGAIYLISDFNWSPWTLVFTLFLFSRWKEWNPNAVEEVQEVQEPKESKIILEK